MRKFLFILFLVHCGLMSFGMPQSMGNINRKKAVLVFEQHVKHYQVSIIDDDSQYETEDDDVESDAIASASIPVFSVYSYTVPARAPELIYLQQKQDINAPAFYIYYQNLRI